MAIKFLVKELKDLKDFFDVAVCNGTIRYGSKKTKITKPFFPSFFLRAEADKLLVLAVDPYKKKTRGKFTLKNVEVYKEGQIPITDYEKIKKVLDSSLPKKNIIVESERGNKIRVYGKDEKDEYTLKQGESKHIAMYSKSQIADTLKSWVAWHEFLDTGELIMNHPKYDDPIRHPMKLKIQKKDFLKVVGDAEKLTYDNKTRLKFDGEHLMGMKGQPNADFQSKHVIEVENMLDGTVEFDEEFYNIQTVIPNLFDEIIINVRKVEKNDTVYIYLESETENVRAEIGWGSIVKDEKE